jgi:predicted RNA polymerase sigma factor
VEDRVNTAHRRHCRVTHDIDIAKELAQIALVTALELWPEEGIPENPGAWLMTAAKRRAIDSLRRGHMLLQKHEAIARELDGNNSSSQLRWSTPWIR